MFIALLSFSESLGCIAQIPDQKVCLRLNDESCMVRPSLNSLNPVEPKYYRFMISLDKSNGSCNVLSRKYVFRKNK